MLFNSPTVLTIYDSGFDASESFAIGYIDFSRITSTGQEQVSAVMAATKLPTVSQLNMSCWLSLYVKLH